MKNLFASYYELSESRIKEIWSNSLIVFDANVLLNLYRYNKSTRDEFFRLMKSYKNRLWIPYQVALEFHRNREKVVKDTYEAFQKIGNEFESKINLVCTQIVEANARLHYIDISKIQEYVGMCIESISKNLTQQQSKHPDFTSNDTVLDIITNLYEGKVGADFSMDELQEIYKEGEKRYEHIIPPGYKDAKNKKSQGNRVVYGDLIVWKQTLNKSKEDNIDIIFVTNDNKSDWWDKIDGKHSPRKELIQEFMDFTGRNIILYTSDKLLEYATNNEEAKISQNTIDEIAEETKLSNEQIENNEYLNVDLLSHLEVIRKVSRFVANGTCFDIDAVRKIKEITESYKYLTNFGDVARSLYEPASLSNFRELSHKLKDFRETVDSMGGFREIQRKIQELSELTSFTRSKDSKENLVHTNSLEQATQ